LTQEPARPANCAACAHWRQLRETEGLCSAHAPRTSLTSETVAHWPQVHNWQWCGEGVATIKPVGARCGECQFWHQPEGGLEPFLRSDMPASWWAHAGLCLRHAPRAVAEPGPRTFWRATQESDRCGDGVPRASAGSAKT
jgi:hypothetical protein